MTNVASSFIKTWNNRTLEDWGGVVSPDFQKFQNAFLNAILFLSPVRQYAPIVKVSIFIPTI